MIKSIGWGFGRCNFRCKHCYGGSTHKAAEHTFLELKTIADKICPQINSINYGTGEFVYNPNAMIIANYIARQYPHIRQAVTTNGTSIVFKDPEQQIKPIFSDVDVSIDFPNRIEHEDFRMHPKAWDWAIKALEICEELKIEHSIVTCVTSQTADKDIMEFLDLAKKYNASWRTNWFRKTGRGKDYLRLTPNRFWKIIKLLADNKVIFECLSDPLLANILGEPGKNPVKGCACGQTSCRIQTDLSVTPCVYLNGKMWSGGSLTDRTLEQIEQSNNFRRIRNRFPDKCKECEFGESCRGGCASRAYLHSKDLNKPDDYCPFTTENKDTRDIIGDIRSRFVLSKTLNVLPGTNKVHDGYLCTAIFKPN